jgi:uncharacterized membrane protein YbaN (DUF454 family)
MEEEKKTKTKMSPWEIFWIALTGVIAVGGLFMIVLGIVGDYLPVLADKNWILEGESGFKSKMHMNYRWFGSILLIGSALISLIYLNYFAKKSDIDEERALRRQQRLSVISASEEATKAQEAAKEAEAKATEVSSTPKAADYQTDKVAK